MLIVKNLTKNFFVSYEIRHCYCSNNDFALFINYKTSFTDIIENWKYNDTLFKISHSLHFFPFKMQNYFLVVIISTIVFFIPYESNNFVSIFPSFIKIIGYCLFA